LTYYWGFLTAVNPEAYIFQRGFLNPHPYAPENGLHHTTAIYAHLCMITVSYRQDLSNFYISCNT